MKHIKTVVSLILVLIAVFALATTALAYTETSVSGTRYVTSSNGNPVNVRTGPGTSYSLAAVGRFDTGTKVTLHAKATGTDGKTWYRVTNSAGVGGWIRGDFLTTNTNSQLKCLTERIRFFALTKPSEVRRTGGTLNGTRQSQGGKDDARIKPF